MDHSFQSPAVLSFCPGVLGLERGLERAIGKINIVAYCEIEAFICANLVAGMEAGVLAAAPIWTDAKTFPAEGFRNKVHGIIGGYPCQPFSTAGKRNGYEDPRHLCPYLREHVRTIRPVWCFFENVRGHLTLGYETVQKELNDLGYAVESGIFTAEEVGAPHQRERLFILAISDTPRQQDWRLQQSGLQTNTGTGSIELANSYGNGHGTGARGVSETSSKNETKAQREEWSILLRQWMWNVIGHGSEELVNPTVITKREQTDETNPITESGEAWPKSGQRCDRWPARPGEQQYEWEEPHTIESGLGRYADGYNFREDILRALGNSVVEQTAELAFRTLLAKHLKNIG